MAYNGDGTFSLPFSWVNDSSNGIPITASRMDTQFNNCVTGFDTVICRDGQSTITNDIPWGGFRLTGLGAATTAGDALSYGGTATLGATTFTGVVTGQALIDISNAAAGQIKFPATQNSSADVNTLDDYEEGTWTPAVTFGGAAVGVTYTYQVGTYVKIGKAVSVVCSISLSSKGSSTGALAVTGFPFPAQTLTNQSTPFGVFMDSLTGISGSLAAVLASAASSVVFRYTGTGSAVGIDNTNCNNNLLITFSGTYHAAT